MAPSQGWPRSGARGSVPAASRSALDEARLESLRSRVHEIELLLRPDGAIVDVNAAAVAAYGYEREELLRLHVRDLRAPETLTDVDPQLARARDVDGVRFETRHRRRDGRTFPVEVSSRTIRAGEATYLHSLLRDLTAEHAAAARRRQDEAHWRSLFDLSPVGTVVMTPDGRLLAFNARAHEQLGYTREEFARLHVSDIDGSDRADDFQRRVAEVLGGARLRFETVHRTKDGALREVVVRAQLVGPVDGAPAILATLADITEERAARRALAESEGWLKASQLVARMGHYVYDPAADRWTSSEGLDVLFGIGPVFPRTGQGWLSLVREDARQGMTEHLEGVLAGRHPFDREYPILHARTGEERWVHGLGALRPGADGRPALFGTIQDVTERRRAAEAQRRQEDHRRRLEAAVEQAPVSIVITNVEGRIEYVNPAFERLTGYARHEAVGQNPRVLKSDRHPPEFYRELWETIMAGRTWEGRLENRARDGRLFTELATISPVRGADGAIRHFVAVKRDVTAELALAERSASAQRLEAIGRLAGGVAHDFNNVLSVVLSCAGVVRQAIREGRPVEAEDADEILLAGERARDLTRQLLAFARRQQLRPVPLDLNDVLANSERMLGRVLGEDLALEVRRQPGLWPLEGDVGQLEQVVVNLAANARDAMPAGGRLVVETANLDADEAQAAAFPGMAPGPYVRLAVEDSGHGMPPEIAARAFEPFFTTKAVGAGTGLGLATVHGIVTQLGGFVRVDSAEGRGTRFELCFPRSLRAPAPPVEPQARSPRTGRETVLLVEDDPHVRLVAERTLAAAGYRVLIADGGEGALARVAALAGPLHLVVSDMVMPGGDGYAVATAVRLVRPEARVLFVSGYPDDVLAARGLLDQPLEILAKPFTPDELLARVRAVLDGAPPAPAGPPGGAPA